MKIEARGKGIYVGTPGAPGGVRIDFRLSRDVDVESQTCGHPSALRTVTSCLDHRQDPGLQVIRKHRPSLDDGCQIAIDVSTPCARVISNWIVGLFCALASTESC